LVTLPQVRNQKYNISSSYRRFKLTAIYDSALLVEILNNVNYNMYVVFTHTGIAVLSGDVVKVLSKVTTTDMANCCI